MRTSLLVAAALAFLPAVALPAFAQRRPDRSPNVGDPAPDFELPRLGARENDRDARIRLSSFRDRRPVVLVFGSYT